jgi:NAD(P)-dependent dehydrogenase (short-subunit alcohol dehydrogenase family)
MPTAVVTGTDQGLGRAFVEELVGRGFRVFAGSHALAKGRSEARELSAAVTELALDVTDPVLVQSLTRFVEARAGSLDLLVNNAAVNPEKGVPLEELDFDVVKHVLDVNALGPLRMTQSLLPLLERAPTKTIVNVSSEAGSLATCGRSSWFGYCMSKAALNVQTRILENYLSSRGFSVLCVHPGWMRTPMAEFQGPVPPEESAASIARMALDSPRTRSDASGFAVYDGTVHPW